jgi:hypothetical protein
MVVEPAPRVILDPSVVFGDDVLEWLRDPAVRPYLAVSATLVDLMAQQQALPQFAEFGQLPGPNRIQEVRAGLIGIRAFSWKEVEDLSPDALEIRDALLYSQEPLAEALADEFVFLLSHSWGIIGGVKRTLEAFQRAGAKVIEVSREQWIRALRAVRESLPPPLLTGMKSLREMAGGPAGAVVLAVAGTAAAVVFPHLGLPLQVLTDVLAGNTVIAGDP